MTLWNRKSSSRTQINIKEVKDGILILPGNKVRVILETSAVNFELKSEEEQDQIIDSFKNFLNSLPCSVQVLIRTREIDIDSYLTDFMQENGDIKDSKKQEQLKDYSEFIKKLVSGNKILTRKFYIVLNNSETDEKQSQEIIKEHLLVHADIVKKGLEKLGMKTRSLGNLEILDLFYSFYNPSHHKTQPLTEQTYQSLYQNSYGI